MLGILGTLTLAIAGDGQPGEVRVRLRDGVTEHLVAYCRRPVPAGWEVLVVSARGPRSVDVEPWSLGGDPLDDAGAPPP